MTTPAIMLFGIGSNAGKSLICAGLCRLFSRRGLNVRPFKPQNMSNNAAVTEDGGEIGRAQALQARACGLAPSIHMNPVLLKPESETGAQVIVQGKRLTSVAARDYAKLKDKLMPAVLDSFRHMEDEAGLVIVEGAGSPAEVNLRQGDIANLGFAEAANVPGIIIGDIERGGVIASLIGSHALLENFERKYIAGFLINRFRGDPGLFEDGMKIITQRTGWQALGIIPWFDKAELLPPEDTLGMIHADEGANAHIKIAVLQLSRIANFDDFDPLRLEPDVELQIIKPGRAIPGDTDLVIIPGTKSTIGDLEFLISNFWDGDIKAHLRRGGHVLGLCGGYQMLGNAVHDDQKIESPAPKTSGLGLLDIQTSLLPGKTLTRIKGRHIASGAPIEGYEIHLGETTGPDCARPFMEIEGKFDGAISKDGRVMGTYIHGLFASDDFRHAFLSMIRKRGQSELQYEETIEQTLDDLADHLESHLDADALLKIAQSRQ